MITITHTHADGTLLAGSRKGDGVYELLKGLRDNWRYFPSIRAIGIGQSRDHLANTYKISRAAEALRAAGHEVTVEIDDAERRSFAEAEAERYERAERRAEYHEERAQVAESRAAGHWKAENAILDGIPFGQPILVGHHSEARHRRDLARAESHMRHGIEELGKRDYHEQRATTAERYRDHRESVPVTLRRIEKIEAEQRDIQRRLDGYTAERGGPYARQVAPATGNYRERLLALQAQHAEELGYWRGVIAKAAESGVRVWSAADFTKGDYVLFIGTWYEVLRVNAKSVTIPGMIGARRGPICSRADCTVSWTDNGCLSQDQGPQDRRGDRRHPRRSGPARGRDRLTAWPRRPLPTGARAPRGGLRRQQEGREMTTEIVEGQNFRDWQENKSASFLPGGQTRGDSGLPAVQVAGALVFAYVRDGILRVSVDLDTVSDSAYWPQTDEMIIPVEVSVQGSTVWQADADGNETSRRPARADRSAPLRGESIEAQARRLMPCGPIFHCNANGHCRCENCHDSGAESLFADLSWPCPEQCGQARCGHRK